VRSQEARRQGAISLSTGWGKEEDRRRAEEAGFNAHLVKPVSPDLLAKTLSGMVPPTERAAPSSQA
jgi:CheY-like chemotaxis protein